MASLLVPDTFQLGDLTFSPLWSGIRHEGDLLDALYFEKGEIAAKTMSWGLTQKAIRRVTWVRVEGSEIPTLSIFLADKGTPVLVGATAISMEEDGSPQGTGSLLLLAGIGRPATPRHEVALLSFLAKDRLIPMALREESILPWLRREPVSPFFHDLGDFHDVPWS